MSCKQASLPPKQASFTRPDGRALAQRRSGRLGKTENGVQEEKEKPPAPPLGGAHAAIDPGSQKHSAPRTASLSTEHAGAQRFRERLRERFIREQKKSPPPDHTYWTASVSGSQQAVLGGALRTQGEQRGHPGRRKERSCNGTVIQ